MGANSRGELMALSLPHLPKIRKTDPHLADTLESIQQYINNNVTQVPGNAVPPPDPNKRPTPVK